MVSTDPTRQASRRLLIAAGFLWGSTALLAQAAAPAPRAAQPPQSTAPKPSDAAPAAGSTLPAMSPTGQPNAQPGSASDVASPAPPPAPVVHRIDVSYSSGKLDVDAENGSLNQILRDISVKTGMKITGGVADEPVFGHYGPASPATVLATLLDGTSANMLLLADKRGGSELILTPREGAPTPPDPKAAALEAKEDAAAPRPEEPQFPGRSRNSRFVRPTAEMAQQIENTGNNTSTQGSATDSTQSSPNGIRTPQQIYNELRQAQTPQTPPQPQ